MLEVCCDSLESVRNALEGGAQRLELCSALSLGGLTPTAGFVRVAAAMARERGVPCNVLMRCRAGDFVFSSSELDAMVEDIRDMKQHAAGFVIGVLTAEGRVDVLATKRLVGECGTSSCTFNRAFDLVPDLILALEDVIECGCERVLTSGGCDSAFRGKHVLKQLVDCAMGRVVVIAGCGVTADNLAQLVAESGVTEVHGSFATSKFPTASGGVRMGRSDEPPLIASADNIRTAITELSK